MKSIILFSIIFLVLMGTFSEAADTVKIAVIETKGFWWGSVKMVEYMAQEQNQQGGLLGKKVEVLAYDNQQTALGSKLVAKKAVEKGTISMSRYKSYVNILNKDESKYRIE